MYAFRHAPRYPVHSAALWISVVRAKQTFTSVDDQLSYFASLPEEQLAAYDIAYLNLVCAQGLNGSENLDITACIARLDEMAAHIRAKIEASQYLYERDPASFENTPLATPNRMA